MEEVNLDAQSQNSKITSEKKVNDEAANKIEKILMDNLSCEMYHFLLSVYYSPHFTLKFVYVFFILLGFGLSSYMTISLILTYLEYNVNTLTRSVNEVPSIFPKVTICNVNLYTTKYAYDYLTSLNLTLTQIESLINSGDLTNAIFVYSTNNRNVAARIQQELSDEEKQAFSHTLNQTLLSCMFNFQPCTANDFKWEWDRMYGNCFSFNSGLNATGETSVPLKESYQSGNTFGLTISFYTNFYEKLMFYNSIYNGYGLVVRIENVSHVIDYANDGIFIPSGLHTYLALNREFKTSLPKPYSECDNLNSNDFNTDLYKLILYSKYEYTQQFCLQQCLQELMINTCNCSNTALASIRNVSGCASMSQINCILKKAFYGIYLKNNYVVRVCLPQCPLECNSTKITYTPSSFQLIPYTYMNLLREKSLLRSDFLNRSLDDDSVILKSVAKLSIFYDSLSYTISIESPQMDIVSLVSQIGGNLGLFMGVCLFSLGEMVITLIELILYKCAANKKIITIVFFG